MRFHSKNARPQSVSRHLLLLASGALAVAGCAAQIKPAQPQFAADFPPLSPVEVALEQNVTLSLDKVPFEELMKIISEKIGPNVIVDWVAFDNAGVQKTTPVSVHLTNVPLGKALTCIFPDNQRPNVDYAVDGNILTIAPHDALMPSICTRVYNVRDLVSSDGMDALRPPPGTQPSPPATPYSSDIIQLESWVKSVDPTSWVDNGGSVGELDDFHGLFLIRNTQRNHRKIQEILIALRRANFEYLDRSGRR